MSFMMASSFNKEVALIFLWTKSPHIHSKSVNCKNTEHQSLFALSVTYISGTDGAAYKN